MSTLNLLRWYQSTNAADGVQSKRDSSHELSLVALGVSTLRAFLEVLPPPCEGFTGPLFFSIDVRYDHGVSVGPDALYHVKSS